MEKLNVWQKLMEDEMEKLNVWQKLMEVQAKLVEDTPLIGMDSKGIIQLGSDDFKKTFAKYDKTSIDERWTMLSAEMNDVKFIALEKKEIE